jgi:4'-phosphopantetheinyl transferase superfamily
VTGAGPHLMVVSADRPLGVHELSPGEAGLHSALPGDHARRRWRTGRRALRGALTLVGLDADTSTIRFPHRRVSLTYAGDGAAAVVAVDDRPERCGIGIDRQLPAAWRPSRSAARFLLTQAEARWLERAAGPDYGRVLLRLWTVKEALFKADPGNADRRLGDYRLADPGAGCGRAEVAGDPTSFWYRSDAPSAGPGPGRGPVVQTVAVAEG